MFNDDIPYDSITWHELKHRFVKTIDLQAIIAKPGSGENVGISPAMDRVSMNNRWPDEIIPGWEGGTIQFTLGIIFNRNGKWHGITPIEFWGNRLGAARYWTGLLVGNWHNWSYNFESLPADCKEPSWKGPQVGDEVGFVLIAGDRREKDIGTIYERSNILRVRLVADGVCPRVPGDVVIGEVPIPGDEVPNVPVPSPGNNNSPVPSETYIIAALMEIRAELKEIKAEVKKSNERTYTAVQDGSVEFLGQRKFKVVSKLTPEGV